MSMNSLQTALGLPYALTEICLQLGKAMDSVFICEQKVVQHCNCASHVMHA